MPVESSPLPRTDEQLAASIGRRDTASKVSAGARDALSELYGRHAPRLLAFLSSRVARCDIEDVHQAVWLRVWQSLGSSEFTGSFRGWLFQIAKNHLIDRARKRRPDLLAEPHLLTDQSAKVDEPMLEADRQAILQRCLGNLETLAAGVVRGRLSGLSYDEICARLEMESSRAHRVWHEAKRQLQECVGRAMS